MGAEASVSVVMIDVCYDRIAGSGIDRDFIFLNSHLFADLFVCGGKSFEKSLRYIIFRQNFVPADGHGIENRFVVVFFEELINQVIFQECSCLLSGRIGNTASQFLGPAKLYHIDHFDFAERISPDSAWIR